MPFELLFFFESWFASKGGSDFGRVFSGFAGESYLAESASPGEGWMGAPQGCPQKHIWDTGRHRAEWELPETLWVVGEGSHGHFSRFSSGAKYPVKIFQFWCFRHGRMFSPCALLWWEGGGFESSPHLPGRGGQPRPCPARSQAGGGSI